MNCEGKLMDCLSDYLDGELDADRCSQIEAHMADCECCREFVESLKASLEAVHRLDRVEAPDDTCREALARLMQQCRGSDE